MAEYGTGRIQFTPNDRSDGPREYSERSIIQLVDFNFPHIALRARDVEHNNETIFEIPLETQDQYKFGNSMTNPDEVRGNNGIYRLWLSEGSRQKFHEVLRNCLALIEMMKTAGEDPPKPKPATADPPKPKPAPVDHSKSKPPPADTQQSTIRSEPSRLAPAPVSPKDLLLDIHLLGQYIEQGDAGKAAEKASQLVTQGIQIQRKSSENTRNEKEFTVQVRIDGNEYGVDQSGAQIPVNVFQSTTVRELRAAFELAYNYPPVNQYFFVNGCLAHDNSTMRQLKVGPNSLFILFLLKHSTKTGPWRCSACPTNNQSHNLRCTSCSATRQN